MRGLIVLALLLLFWGVADPQQLYYTVQVATYKGPADAEENYQRLLEALPEQSRGFLRIELIKGLYALRVGRFNTYKEARELLRYVRPLFPDAYVMKAYILEERIKKLYQVQTVQPEVSEKQQQSPEKTGGEALSQPEQPVKPRETVGPAEDLSSRSQPQPGQRTIVPVSTLLPVGIILFVLLVYSQRHRFKSLVTYLVYSEFFRTLTERFKEQDEVCTENPRHIPMLYLERVKTAISDIELQRIDMPLQLKYDSPVKGSILICRDYPGQNRHSAQLVFVVGDWKVPHAEKIMAEVVVRGSVLVGEDSVIKAVVCETEATLSRGVKVMRFVDAEFGLQIHQGCTILGAATCGRELVISKGCVFRCLSGRPIRTYNCKTGIQYMNSEQLQMLQASHLDVPVKFLKNSILFSKMNLTIPELLRANKNIVSAGTLTVMKGSVINGYLKAQRDVVIHEGVLINGDIYAYNNVIVGRGVRIYGSISARGQVIIDSGARIGSSEKEVKITSGADLKIMEDVEIYGDVFASQKGQII